MPHEFDFSRLPRTPSGYLPARTITLTRKGWDYVERPMERFIEANPEWIARARVIAEERLAASQARYATALRQRTVT